MKKAFLILISAVLIGLSRLPLYTGWLVFFALLPMLYYFEKGKSVWKELVRDSFVYSAVSLTIWMHWITGVTASGFAGMILFYTIYYFLTFLTLQTIWQKLYKLRFIGFVAVFLSVEHLQNFTEFRFPWINIGYSLADYTVLLQAADIGGVTLLSLFILLITVFLYQVLLREWKYLIWIGVILLVWTGYGIWCMKTISLTEEDAKISVMQPSIPQDEKWEASHFDAIYDRYVTLTRKAAEDSTKLLIWPEAAIPAHILRQPEFLPLVQNLCNQYNLEIFTGFPDVLTAPADYPGISYYYNAATLFRPYRPYEEPYYKIILVPVAERMLYLDKFPILWKLQFGQANWEFGTEYRYYQSGNAVFSPQICFEIAFAELTRRMAFRNLGESTGTKPDKIDFLVNITNDAWFGRSAGPWIHGMLTKFRAVENRIQIYRSANTGISMVVDPLGRIIRSTNLFEVTLIKAPLYRSAKIPLYYYLHNWTLSAVIAALLMLAAALLRRTKSKPRTGEQR